MPSYLNAGTRANSSGATSLSPALPASRTSGNLLIAVAGSKNNFAHTCATAGWTKFAQQNSGTAWTVSLWVYRRTQGGVDGSETAPAITVGTSSVACFAQVIQYSGTFDPTDLLGGAVNVNAGTSSTHSCNGIVTTADNSLVIYIDAAAANTALATPTGWTEELDNGSNTGATRNANGSKSISAAGTSSGNISVTGASAAWVMWQIELRSQVVPHAWVTSKFETDASQSSYTFPSRTPDAQKAQIVIVFWFRGGTTPNVTLNGCGLTWTKVAESIETATDQQAVALFKGTGTPSTGVVTVSFGTAPSRAAGVALEIDNVDKADPVKQFGTAATSGDSSLTVTLPTAPTGQVIGAFNAKWMPQLGSGFAQVTALAVGSSWDQIRCRVETKSADQTIDATFDLGACVAIGFELKPPTAGYTLTAGSGSYAVTGKSTGLSASRRLGAQVGSYTLTGQDLGLTVSRRLGAQVGSYTLTGQGLGLRVSRYVQAISGTYTLVGYAGILAKPKLLIAQGASYTLTGLPIGLSASRSLSVQTTSYTLEGKTAGLMAFRRLGAEAEAYTLAGTAAGLSLVRLLGTQARSYIITSMAAGLSASRSLGTQAGSYSIDGMTTGLNLGRRIGAQVGSYTLTGQSADVMARRRIDAHVGSYMLTGQSVNVQAERLCRAVSGTFLLTAYDASLFIGTQGLKLDALAGSFVLTAPNGGLYVARRMPTVRCEFDLSGVPLSLMAERQLLAGTGTMTLAGLGAFLRANRVIVPGLGTFDLSEHDAELFVARLLQAGVGHFIFDGKSVSLSVISLSLVTLQKEKILQAKLRNGNITKSELEALERTGILSGAAFSESGMHGRMRQSKLSNTKVMN
jgi:hypothetical protein